MTIIIILILLLAGFIGYIQYYNTTGRYNEARRKNEVEKQESEFKQQKAKADAQRAEVHEKIQIREAEEEGDMYYKNKNVSSSINITIGKSLNSSQDNAPKSVSENQKQKESILSYINKCQCTQYDKFMNEFAASTKMRSNRMCGCYAIIISNIEISNPYKFMIDYSKVYIGRSMDLYEKANSHFTGNGSKEINNALHSNKWVYVKFIPCEKDRIDEFESNVIGMFNAVRKIT